MTGKGMFGKGMGNRPGRELFLCRTFLCRFLLNTFRPGKAVVKGMIVRGIIVQSLLPIPLVFLVFLEKPAPLAQPLVVDSILNLEPPVSLAKHRMA
jgi:hypothetical protein